MPFDGLVTRALTDELNNKLKGGRIEKIYQPLRDELFFQIGANREKHVLFMSSNSSHPRLYLTQEKSQNPVNPSPFCMLLRKHLTGGRIMEVVQHGTDRIVEFHIVNSNELAEKESKTLVVEIMGRHSNIILVDGKTGTIIDAIKHVPFDVSRERQILPKIPYDYPPTKSNITYSDDAFQTQNFSPVIYYDGDKPVGFYVKPLEDLEGAKKREFDSVSKMLDSYYSGRDSSNRMKQKSSDLLKTIKQNTNKLNLKVQRLLEDLEKAKKGDTWKLYGELLTANLHNLSDGLESVTLTDYYTNEDVTIKLDSMLTPSENAQVYYKKYNKSKTALDEKTKQLDETRETLTMLDTYTTYINNAETPEDIDAIRDELTSLGYLRKRKKQTAQKPKKTSFLKFSVKGDFTVMVGRNNKENDELTLKKASSHDIWFHTKDIPGSHLILFTDGRHPEEATILEAASIAAWYSKGRESQNVPVDYTKVKHVKKPSGAKPGMVIFKDNKTVYVNPRKPEES